MNQHKDQDVVANGLAIDSIKFVILWRLNDWGLYKRRHEAIARDLANREVVASVVHVEHVSFNGVISYLLKCRRKSELKKFFRDQAMKGLAFFPIPAADFKKLYLYSVVVLSARESGWLAKLTDIVTHMQYRAINRHMRKKKGKTVLMVYPPSEYLIGAIQSIDHDVLIADLVDDDLKRTSDEAKKRKALDNYKRVLPSCKLIFATSATFNDTYRDYAKQAITYIPNGVDMGDFTGNIINKLRNIEKKSVGYFGVINHEVDIDLLEHVIRSHPEVDFIVVGYATEERMKDIERIRMEFKNFHYLGRKRHSDIPRMMENLDVLINIKKADHSTSGGESIKTYEYLAAGKPVVTTLCPPADKFADLIYIANNEVEFALCVKVALAEDDEELRKRRVKAAAENSWSKRVDVILKDVAGLLEKNP